MSFIQDVDVIFPHDADQFAVRKLWIAEKVFFDNDEIVVREKLSKTQRERLRRKQEYVRFQQCHWVLLIVSSR